MSNLSFFQKFWSQSLGTFFSIVRASWKALYDLKWRTRRCLSFGTFASFVSKLKTCEKHKNVKGSNLKIQLARVFLTNWVANWENQSKKLHFFCWEGQLLLATFLASCVWLWHVSTWRRTARAFLTNWVGSFRWEKNPSLPSISSPASTLPIFV